MSEYPETSVQAGASLAQSLLPRMKATVEASEGDQKQTLSKFDPRSAGQATPAELLVNASNTTDLDETTSAMSELALSASVAKPYRIEHHGTHMIIFARYDDSPPNRTPHGSDGMK